MKKLILLLLAFTLNSFLYAQHFATIRIGNTNASSLSPGDSVYVPVYCDVVSQNAAHKSAQFQFEFDPTVLTWTGIAQGFIGQQTGFWSFASFPGVFDALYFNFGLAVPLLPETKLFETIFIYQGGETMLNWVPEMTSMQFFTLSLVDGCICDNNYVNFNVTSGGEPLTDAAVIINTDTVMTGWMGNSVFLLPDGNYTYSVFKPGFVTHTGSFILSGSTLNLEVELEPEETYAVSFFCDVSCENQYNGWNIIINQDTLYSGQTTFLPEGDWLYSTSWLDCWPLQGEISVYGPVIIECAYVGTVEPHATFHINSNQGGDIEGATVTVNSFIIMTDSLGQAGFCLSGGDHSYSISKEGYDIISGVFSYTNYCQDTTVNITINTVNVEYPASNDFRIYPNPTDGKFYIETDIYKCNSSVVLVMDLTGNIIYTCRFENNKEILVDLSELQKGLYFIQLHADNLTNSYKLILK